MLLFDSIEWLTLLIKQCYKHTVSTALIDQNVNHTEHRDSTPQASILVRQQQWQQHAAVIAEVM
jgi:hypothetical protein